MIYSRIFGGLGNQLFQYCVGRSVAIRVGQELVLDTRLCRPGTHWDFALNHFEIKADIGDPENLPPDKTSPLRYAIWRYLRLKPTLLREDGLAFDPRVLDAGDETYLHGYFQSERYFADIAAQIRSDLTFKTPPDDENQRWLDEIESTPSVSLHVRRGDYVETGKNSETHGTCDQDYYTRALNVIAERADGDFTVFIFSDDPTWAAENLSFEFDTRVAGHNGSERHYEDMRLISACQHNIIANSTFSWWGAWLNRNEEKIVIGPRRWFNKASLSNPDILPQNWTAI